MWLHGQFYEFALKINQFQVELMYMVLFICRNLYLLLYVEILKNIWHFQFCQFSVIFFNYKITLSNGSETTGWRIRYQYIIPQHCWKCHRKIKFTKYVIPKMLSSLYENIWLLGLEDIVDVLKQKFIFILKTTFPHCIYYW